MGPPTATPITGPPAPTSDQHPRALTRSPLVEHRQHERHGRGADRRPHHAAEHAGGDEHADVRGRRPTGWPRPISAMIPIMKRRRWPKQVPGLAHQRGHDAEGEQRPGDDPGDGGDAGVQALATSGSATTKTVKRRLLASRPDSATPRTHHW